MPYDLRNFIDDLKKAGELVEFDTEADWNYEISAFEVMSAKLNGPAFLFNKIKGIPEGRVLVGHFAGPFRKSHRRIAIALGMNPDVDRLTFFAQAGPRMMNMLRPVEVATGPCKEIIKMGKDVNLLEFPFIYHAIGDGARYMFQNVVTIKDPDSDWINSGNYGIGVYSRNRLVITPYAHTNWLYIYSTKYQARNQSMPVAVVLGGDPAVNMTAGMILPPALSEYDLAGGLRGAPIEMVRCETSDLLVPADAEVVMEGEVPPYERLMEGPKVESFGFSVGPRQPFYPIRVHCITQRKNPIINHVAQTPGSSVNALHDLMTLGFFGAMKATNLPIKMGHGATPIRTGATMFYSVKDKPYPGYMHDVYNLTLGHPALSVFASKVYLDSDVDLFDESQRLEALFTQTNPAKDIIKTERGHPAMTIESSWMEEEDRAKYVGPGTIYAQHLLVDTTTKEEPPLGVRRTSFETLFPEELQKWVLDNWQRLGFTEEPRWSMPYIKAEF